MEDWESVYCINVFLMIAVFLIFLVLRGSAVWTSEQEVRTGILLMLVITKTMLLAGILAWQSELLSTSALAGMAFGPNTLVMFSLACCRGRGGCESSIHVRHLHAAMLHASGPKRSTRSCHSFRPPSVRQICSWCDVGAFAERWRDEKAI